MGDPKGFLRVDRAEEDGLEAGAGPHQLRPVGAVRGRVVAGQQGHRLPGQQAHVRLHGRVRLPEAGQGGQARWRLAVDCARRRAGLREGERVGDLGAGQVLYAAEGDGPVQRAGVGAGDGPPALVELLLHYEAAPLAREAR